MSAGSHKKTWGFIFLRGRFSCGDWGMLYEYEFGGLYILVVRTVADRIRS